MPVDGYDATPWNGITDYCFYDPSGNVIAGVEAKRTCRNPREGEEQVAGMFSADDLKRLRFLREHGKLTQGTARIAPGV